MATIEIKDGRVVVHLHGWDVVMAMRGSLSVPFSHVEGVRVRPREAYFDDVVVAAWSGVGSYRYGKHALGTLQLADGRSFFDVRDPERTIAIDLENEGLEHLILELHRETPESAVDRITSAIDAWRDRG